MLDQPGQLREVVGHERDVGGLDRGIAAAAHGDAEARPRHGRRVVDAVADHGDGAVLRDQRLDRLDLVLGQELGMDLVDADLARDRLGGRAVVAGQHDQVLDPRARRSPITARLRPHRIGHRDQAADVPLVADHHDRVTGPLERRGAIDHLAGLLAAFHDVAMRAEPEGLARDGRRSPLPWRTCTPSAGAISIPRLGMLDDRLGERVGAPGLERGGALDQLLLAVAAERHDPTTAGCPQLNVPVLSNAMALRPAGCST